MIICNTYRLLHVKSLILFDIVFIHKILIPYHERASLRVSDLCDIK